jgi:hypothetical protein
MSTKTSIPPTLRVCYGFVVDQFRHSLLESIECGYQKAAMANDSGLSVDKLDGFLNGTAVLTIPELQILAGILNPGAELWVEVPIGLVDPDRVFDEPFYRVPPVETNC